MSGWLEKSSAQSDDHVITDIKGKLSIKRMRWSKFAPAYIGMSVGNGDTFRLDAPDSKGSVTCSDGSTRPVDHNLLKLQCANVARDNKPVLPPSHNRRRVGKVRGGSEVVNEYPILVSPRMTKLLNPTPLIRWLPAKNATSYKVSVFDGTKEIWSVTVDNATQVRYPSDPKLSFVPGKTYSVVIDAGDDRLSTREKMINLGFSLLPPEEAKKVREAETRIRDLHLPDATTRLLVSELYADWADPNVREAKALTAEAIELLEGLGDTTETAVVRQLADLYLTIGVNGRAEGFYLRAVKLSQDAGDIEGQALAELALGRIFAKTRLNKNEALQRLQNAKRLYESLGDAAAAAEVELAVQQVQK
jgi:hypothetical protein